MLSQLLDSKKWALAVTLLALAFSLVTLPQQAMAGEGGGDPPVVTIYDMTPAPVEVITVEVDEQFTLLGSATGDIPLYYFWYEDELIATGFMLIDYSFSEPGEYIITLEVVDCNGLTGSDTVLIIVEGGSSTGAICGTITDNDLSPLAGVTVKVLDNENNPVADPVVTGPDGIYLFEDLDIATYSVGIVTPLGFQASPGETQTEIEPTNPYTEIDFALTPIITANDSRTMGFWKHQFDSYLSGHGTAHVAEADLNVYLDAVYQHFDILGIYTELGTFDFEDAKDALAVRGDEPLVESAKQQLFAMLLNFAATNIGNYSIVTEDNRKACEVVTYAAAAIKDGDPANDETAADVCAVINRGGLAPAGIVPESNTVYKFGDGSMPNEFCLEQNYPNPFNPSTAMSFVLPKASHVKLQVFDMLGRVVTTVYEGHLEAGAHSYSFDGSKIASGVYLYRLTAGDMTETRKMVLLK